MACRLLAGLFQNDEGKIATRSVLNKHPAGIPGPVRRAPFLSTLSHPFAGGKAFHREGLLWFRIPSLPGSGRPLKKAKNNAGACNAFDNRRNHAV